MIVSRRQFLQGASACAVAAALSDPVMAEADSGVAIAMRYFATRPIFEGSIGTYQGVILRRGAIPQIVDWASLRPCGLVTSTVLEGIEADDGC